MKDADHFEDVLGRALAVIDRWRVGIQRAYQRSGTADEGYGSPGKPRGHASEIADLTQDRAHADHPSEL